MRKPLTVQFLQKEASGFAKRESKHAKPSLFGVTDGKAVGTYRRDALQWRLQYSRVIEQAGKVGGILRLV